MNWDFTRALPDIEAALAAGRGADHDLVDGAETSLDARLRQVGSAVEGWVAQSVNVEDRLKGVLRPPLAPTADGAAPARATTPVAASTAAGGPAATTDQEPARQPISVDVDDRRRATGPAVDGAGVGAGVGAISLNRVAASLDRIDVRYLTDVSGSLLALWERHSVLFTLEGPTDEILVTRVRPHSTVPPDWADRTYRVVNEWNHTRRFCKAYVGDPTDHGQLPIYAEMQVPLGAGVHDALLDELLDCAAAVATGFVDWLHDDGGLL